MFSFFFYFFFFLFYFCTNTDELYPHATAIILSAYKENNQLARIQHDSDTQDNSENNGKNLKGKETTDPSLLKQNFLKSLRQGIVLQFRVVSISPVEVTVKPDYVEKMDINIKATIHISSTINKIIALDGLKKTLSSSAVKSKKEQSEINETHPFYGLEVGNKILARVLQFRQSSNSNKNDRNKNNKNNKNSKNTDNNGSNSSGNGNSSSGSSEEQLIIHLSTDGLSAASMSGVGDSSDSVLSGKRKRNGWLMYVGVRVCWCVCKHVGVCWCIVFVMCL